MGGCRLADPPLYSGGSVPQTSITTLPWGAAALKNPPLYSWVLAWGAAALQTTYQYVTIPHVSTILSCTVLYYTILCCSILYCAVLYFIVLYYTIAYCTVVYFTVLYYSILYCTGSSQHGRHRTPVLDRFHLDTLRVAEVVPHLGLPLQGPPRRRALRKSKLSPDPEGPIPAPLGPDFWRGPAPRPEGQHL